MWRCGGGRSKSEPELRAKCAQCGPISIRRALGRRLPRCGRLENYLEYWKDLAITAPCRQSKFGRRDEHRERKRFLRFRKEYELPMYELPEFSGWSWTAR